MFLRNLVNALMTDIFPNKIFINAQENLTFTEGHNKNFQKKTQQALPSSFFDYLQNYVKCWSNIKKWTDLYNVTTVLCLKEPTSSRLMGVSVCNGSQLISYDKDNIKN